MNYFRYEMGLRGWCAVIYYDRKPDDNSVNGKRISAVTPWVEVQSLAQTLNDLIQAYPPPVILAEPMPDPIVIAPEIPILTPEVKPTSTPNKFDPILNPIDKNDETFDER